MRAYNTYRSIVFTVTTAVTFFFWYTISQLMAQNIWLGTLLSGVISLGTYRIILKFMEWAFLKLPRIKKLLFGSCYLEGIWVGCYLGHDGKPQYYIESFEQDFDGLVIRGKCFYEDRTFKGTWTSERVIIDDEKGRITYTYITDMINNTHKNQGLAEFVFDRINKKEQPNRMVGFSSDIFNPKKFMSIEERVVEKKILTESELLDQAQKVYEKNKEAY